MYNCREGELPTFMALEEWNTTCIQLEDMLSEEQIKMFHKLLDIQSAALADEIRTAYKAGFKDGVTLMKELDE